MIDADWYINWYVYYAIDMLVGMYHPKRDVFWNILNAKFVFWVYYKSIII
jgi:hypothetical protein